MGRMVRLSHLVVIVNVQMNFSLIDPFGERDMRFHRHNAFDQCSIEKHVLIDGLNHVDTILSEKQRRKTVKNRSREVCGTSFDRQIEEHRLSLDIEPFEEEHRER